MQAITNNLAMSNLQASYNRNHTHGNMPKEQVGHEMSKMNGVAGKDDTKINCNMKEMHGNYTSSADAKSDTNINAVDSNLGRVINAQV